MSKPSQLNPVYYSGPCEGCLSTTMMPSVSTSNHTSHRRTARHLLGLDVNSYLFTAASALDCLLRKENNCGSYSTVNVPLLSTTKRTDATGERRKRRKKKRERELELSGSRQSVVSLVARFQTLSLGPRCHCWGPGTEH